jgi:hypothetical protein
MGVPNEYNLLISGDHSSRRCQVAWRREKRIGIAFKYRRESPVMVRPVSRRFQAACDRLMVVIAKCAGYVRCRPASALREAYKRASA